MNNLYADVSKRILFFKRYDNILAADLKQAERKHEIWNKAVSLSHHDKWDSMRSCCFKLVGRGLNSSVTHHFWSCICHCGLKDPDMHLFALTKKGVLVTWTSAALEFPVWWKGSTQRRKRQPLNGWQIYFSAFYWAKTHLPKRNSHSIGDCSTSSGSSWWRDLVTLTPIVPKQGKCSCSIMQKQHLLTLSL